MGDWTFFSNHGHVLVCLARDREARLRDVAEQVGITERAVQKIVRDLQQEGFLEVTKRGRCNRYRINRRKSLRHSLESRCTVGKLLTQVIRGTDAAAIGDDDAGPVSPPAASAGRESVLAALRNDGPGPVEPPAASSSEKSAPASGKKEPRKAKAPADTREQGSLF
jgi:biotin operon repressor